MEKLISEVLGKTTELKRFLDKIVNELIETSDTYEDAIKRLERERFHLSAGTINHQVYLELQDKIIKKALKRKIE